MPKTRPTLDYRHTILNSILYNYIFFPLVLGLFRLNYVTFEFKYNICRIENDLLLDHVCMYGPLQISICTV